jgi:hypothetical protein
MNDAINFLRALDETGAHNLVAIDPATGHVTGHTFQPGHLNDAATWIDFHNGKHNLYASVNEPKPDAPHDKLKKEHIGRIRAIFADLDPSGKGELSEERAAIGAKAEALSASACPPSFIIDSGGGAQFLWKLAHKLEAADKREWAEDQGRAIRHVIGGDAVQNIDRIMRLPGTLNIPTAAKRAKGRTERMAAVVRHLDRTYDPEALGAWVKPSKADEADTDSDAMVQKIMADLDMDHVRAASTFDQLNSGLPSKFEQACERVSGLRDLWDGTASPNDTSGSGWRAALASALGRAGGFTAEEFGQLVWVWGRAVSDGDSRDDKITRRSIARDWTRIGAPKDLAAKWFEPPVVYEPLFPVEHGSSSQDASGPGKIRATPYRFPDPASIPTRKTLYGGHYTRKFVSVTVAPSKVGKTALFVAEMLAMVSGKPLLGRPVNGGPLRVWLWNGEDPLEELERRVAAAMQHYGLSANDLGGVDGSRLFLNSGRDVGIVLAEAGKDGVKIAAPVVGEVTKTLLECGIDVCAIDPFISSHRVPENDNGAIDQVAKKWAGIADAASCSVELVHHVRKLNGSEVTVEDGRGAVALLAASRSARALARMTLEESRRLGIEAGVARRLFRFADCSSNIALPGAEMEEWLELASEGLGNGEGESAVERLMSGDSVGVVRQWKGLADDAPDVAEGPEARALQMVGEGEWRVDIRARDAWVGEPIGIAFGLSRQDKDDVAQIKSIISAMLHRGKLEEYVGFDRNRQKRSYVRAVFNGVFG